MVVKDFFKFDLGLVLKSYKVGREEQIDLLTFLLNHFIIPLMSRYIPLGNISFAEKVNNI